MSNSCVDVNVLAVEALVQFEKESGIDLLAYTHFFGFEIVDNYLIARPRPLGDSPPVCSTIIREEIFPLELIQLGGARESIDPARTILKLCADIFRDYGVIVGADGCSLQKRHSGYMPYANLCGKILFSNVSLPSASPFYKMLEPTREEEVHDLAVKYCVYGQAGESPRDLEDRIIRDKISPEMANDAVKLISEAGLFVTPCPEGPIWDSLGWEVYDGVCPPGVLGKVEELPGRDSGLAIFEKQHEWPLILDTVGGLATRISKVEYDCAYIINVTSETVIPDGSVAIPLSITSEGGNLIPLSVGACIFRSEDGGKIYMGGKMLVMYNRAQSEAPNGEPPIDDLPSWEKIFMSTASLLKHSNAPWKHEFASNWAHTVVIDRVANGGVNLPNISPIISAIQKRTAEGFINYWGYGKWDSAEVKELITLYGTGTCRRVQDFLDVLGQRRNSVCADAIEKLTSVLEDHLRKMIEKTFPMAFYPRDCPVDISRKARAFVVGSLDDGFYMKFNNATREIVYAGGTRSDRDKTWKGTIEDLMGVVDQYDVYGDKTLLVEYSPPFLSPNPVKFYRVKDPYGFFSNLSPHPVNIDGETWPTSEHYFQAMKFDDLALRRKVLQSETPHDAIRIGRDRNNTVRQGWDELRDGVMLRVVRAKVEQHSSIRSALHSTGDREIIEHTEKDSYWGDGGDGSGKNKLGKILMRIRDEIKH